MQRVTTQRLLCQSGGGPRRPPLALACLALSFLLSGCSAFTPPPATVVYRAAPCAVVNGRRWCPLPDLRAQPSRYHPQY